MKAYYLSAKDLLILLYNVQRGATTKEVGFQDCTHTIDDVTKSLTKSYSRVPLPQDFLESALWSCNLMGEAGKFWEPKGESFNTWVRQLCAAHGFKFDEFFNVIDDGEAPGARKIRRD